jgi:hypothetical protein
MSWHCRLRCLPVQRDEIGVITLFAALVALKLKYLAKHQSAQIFGRSHFVQWPLMISRRDDHFG